MGVGREGKISIQKKEAREGGSLKQNPAEFSLVRQSKSSQGLGGVPRLAPDFPLLPGTRNSGSSPVMTGWALRVWPPWEVVSFHHWLPIWGSTVVRFSQLEAVWG